MENRVPYPIPFNGRHDVRFPTSTKKNLELKVISTFRAVWTMEAREMWMEEMKTICESESWEFHTIEERETHFCGMKKKKRVWNRAVRWCRCDVILYDIGDVGYSDSGDNGKTFFSPPNENIKSCSSSNNNNNLVHFSVSTDLKLFCKWFVFAMFPCIKIELR